MGVGAGVYMCDAVKKVHVRYLISWWVLVWVRCSSRRNNKTANNTLSTMSKLLTLNMHWWSRKTLGCISQWIVSSLSPFNYRQGSAIADSRQRFAWKVSHRTCI